MNSQGWSITPSRSNSSAMSLTPELRGMTTIFSCASGPVISKRCLPTTKVTPPISAISNTNENSALPILTNGLRARIGFRIGIITCSGSSAARGLRGAIRLGSVIGAPFCARGEPG